MFRRMLYIAMKQLELFATHELFVRKPQKISLEESFGLHYL